MTILCLASGKGGTGKTTNAAQLAERRAASGRKVLLVDTDKQGSMALWSAQRIKRGAPPIPCISLFGDEVYEQLQAHVRNYDDIVIDTRGTEAHNVEMYAALRAADLVVTPIRTSLFDSATTISMGETLRIVRQLNPKVRAYLMLNDVSTNAKSTRDASVRKQLKGIRGFDGLLAAQVSHRTAFERVAEMGLSVHEFGGDKKAAQELDALAAEVWQ